MRTISILLNLFALVLLPLAARAQFTFVTNSGAITITGYNPAAGLNVVIPANTNGYPVTAIGTNAFYELLTITNVVIPNSVTGIGTDAFFFCTNLTNVAFPNSITNIGIGAFYGCTSLSSVTMLGSSTTIGSGAFAYSGVTNVLMGNGVLNIGDGAFYNCLNLRSITIGNEVTNLGVYAFAYCGNLQLAYFAGNAPLIDGANGSADTTVFNNNTTGPLINYDPTTLYYASGSTGWSYPWCGLPTTAITPPAVNVSPASQMAQPGGSAAFNVTANGSPLAYQWYFNNAAISGATGTSYSLNNLTAVNAGNYYVVVEYYFGGVISSVATLTVAAPAGFTFITNAGAITITGYNTNAGLTMAIPPSTNGYLVTAIASGAFNGLATITNTIIPGTVTNIGIQAFQNCSSLASVTISNGVVSISDAAFYGCSSLTGIAIPNSVTYVGNSAFNGCTSLASASLGANVVTIGESAFQSCVHLGSITIPNSATSIGSYAFFQCSALTNAVVGNDVTSIGAVAFAYAPLANLTLGKGVINLGDQAFYACSGLTSVTIPMGVTNVGVGAFASCTLLRLAYFLGNAPLVDGTAGNMDTSVFNGESGLVFYPPNTTGWANTFGGWPTATGVYQPQPAIAGKGPGFGAHGTHFNFNIYWATNASVVIQASTNLVNWTPIATNTLVSGTNAFSDGNFANYPIRFYRVRGQ